jgi:hypothetical protein
VNARANELQRLLQEQVESVQANERYDERRQRRRRAVGYIACRARYFRQNTLMPRRFQFSVRDMVGLLTLAALIAWAIKRFGIAEVGVAVLLVSPTVGGVLIRRPLEGCLLNVFFLVAVIMGGFVVAGLLAD